VTDFPIHISSILGIDLIYLCGARLRPSSFRGESTAEILLGFGTVLTAHESVLALCPHPVSFIAYHHIQFISLRIHADAELPALLGAAASDNLSERLREGFGIEPFSREDRKKIQGNG